MLILALLACSQEPRSAPPPPVVVPEPEGVSTPLPAASPPPGPRPPVDAGRLVVPGERVGPITASTTRADLDRLFAPEGLDDIDAQVGEGETRPGTRWHEGHADDITIVWLGPDRTVATEVRDLGPAWRTEQGLGMGSTLAELEAALGPFQVYGFGWDYGGTVSLEGTKLAAWQGALWLRLEPEGSTLGPDYPHVVGDRLFPSTDPHLRALEPAVGWMGVALERRPE